MTIGAGVSHRGVTASGLAFLGLLVLVVWLPVPLGSNRPWSMSVFQIFSFLLLSIVLVGAMHGDPPGSRRGLARWPTGALAIWLAFTAFQLVALPAHWLAALSPTSHAIHSAATPGFDAASISVAPGAGFRALLNFAACAALFVVVSTCVTGRRKLRALLWTLVAVGAGQAIYGIATFLHTTDWQTGTVRVTGTYVNQNHFAGLMELSIPAACALLSAGSRRRSDGGGFRERARDMAGMALSRNSLAIVALVLMAAGLVMSTSRGGLGALALSLLVVVGVSRIARVGTSGGTSALKWAGAAAVLAVVVFGARGLTDKLDQQGLDSNRSDIRVAVYRLIEDYPLLGAGAGSFRWVFPSYKDETLAGGLYEHAHNDFLELTAEQGVFGATLGLLSIGGALLVVARGYARRRDPMVKATLFAVLWACTSLLLHGLVDFNLQIPANAALFWVLLGAGVGAVSIGRRRATGAVQPGVKQDTAQRTSRERETRQ